MPDKILDARGFSCPLPILKARRALGEVPPGGTLGILATDPGALQDIVAFCAITGHTLLEHALEGGTYRFIVRRALTAEESSEPRPSAAAPRD